MMVNKGASRGTGPTALINFSMDVVGQISCLDMARVLAPFCHYIEADMLKKRVSLLRCLDVPIMIKSALLVLSLSLLCVIQPDISLR